MSTRPALRWWQRVLCAALSARQLAQWRWYRAHIGGRWSPGWPSGALRPGPWCVSMTLCGCASLWFPQDGVLNRCLAEWRCRCEIYPYPVLPSADAEGQSSDELGNAR